MSHSKRNTSLAFFTSYERSQLRNHWGSQTVRIGRDCFLPFGACKLCLTSSSADPVACTKGDIFCRECAVNNLLSQRKEIKRLEKEVERDRVEEAEREQKQDEEARQRAVDDFDRVQQGLESRLGPYANRRVVGRSADRYTTEDETVTGRQNGEGFGQGRKRKFQLDEKELLRVAEEDHKKAKSVMEQEKHNAAQPKLLSFWVPSLTPSSNIVIGHASAPKPAKMQLTCPSSSEDRPHEISLKTLVTVRFSEDKNEAGETVRSCPSCRKALSNSLKAMLAVPCGHVVCRPCVDQFMKPPNIQLGQNPAPAAIALRCYVCETDLSGQESLLVPGDGAASAERIGKKVKEKGDLKPGLVEIKSDGTGFAAGKGSQVRKQGTAFQC